jgi:deoxyhypusine synthase
MTYPNPSGYYGLQMPEIFEQDITSFDSDRLKQIVWDVTAFLNRDDQAFGYTGSYLSTGFDEWVNTLSETKVIDLIRWLSEVLSAKANKPNA